MGLEKVRPSFEVDDVLCDVLAGPQSRGYPLGRARSCVTLPSKCCPRRGERAIPSCALHTAHRAGARASHLDGGVGPRGRHRGDRGGGFPRARGLLFRLSARKERERMPAGLSELPLLARWGDASGDARNSGGGCFRSFDPSNAGADGCQRSARPNAAWRVSTAPYRCRRLVRVPAADGSIETIEHEPTTWVFISGQ